MLKVRTSTQFDKDYKRAMKRGLKVAKFEKAVKLLATRSKMPAKYRDHALQDSRKYKGLRECHIQPDWLLIYEIDDDELILFLVRTGSHSDLF